MKIKDIQKLVQKHLVPNLNGYRIHRDKFYRIENDYFLKGYYFESSGNDEYDLAVWYFIQPLFVKSDDINFTYGDRLTYHKKINWWKSRQLEWWDARKENIDISFQSILQSALKEGEKFLNSVTTPESFYHKFKRSRKDNIRIYEGVAYSTILFGTERLQNSLLKGLIRFSKNKINDDGTEWIIEIRKDATLLLNADGTNERLNILKSWADKTLRQLKLEDELPSTELTANL